MLRLNRLADYALVLMHGLASLPMRGEKRASAKALAALSRLEEPTVAKLLKRLSAAGLVLAERGASGGYRLARPADAISVAEVIGAIDGPIAWTTCSLHRGACQHESYCAVGGGLRLIAAALDETLRQLTLADLLEPGSFQPAIAIRRRIPAVANLTVEATR